jgi:glucose-1-phosphate thymidylyltransferase
MINYPIDTLLKLGIKDVLIITSREHCGIITEYLGDGHDRGMTFTYKIQEMNDPDRPAGIASALKLAQDFTHDENFMVILGDNYYQWNDTFNDTVETFNKTHEKGCCVFLSKTPNWSEFGVAEFDGCEIVRIVEKPKEYVSDYAVTGMYAYTPDVYQYIYKLEPSARGELEISDINDMYIKKGLYYYQKFDTFWSDMGTPESMLTTIRHINE